MGNLIYLVAPAGAAAVVSLAIMARGRKKPSMERGMKEFWRELGAMAPSSYKDAGRRSDPGRGRPAKGAKAG